LKRTVSKNGAVSPARARPPVLKPLANGKAAKTLMKKTNGLSGSSAVVANISRQERVKFLLEPKLLLQIHDHMVKARVLEERLIRMYKKNDGYFWLGGPGEEAFSMPLAMQIRKGQGLDYDFMHFHYRSTGILLTMGMDPADMMRQMKNTATDPFSAGRNFVAHASIRKWNVIPITSTIETQYVTAIGSGIAQRRHGGKGVTIVNGGDAGTAEGDFASCLVWASRPGNELPMFIIVTNNKYGISTAAGTQHGEKLISDRGRAFGMKTRTINGNDVEESYLAIQEAMAYIRSERKPFLMEAMVSRLYGHSSATGANLVNEEDPIVIFEKKLEAGGLMSRQQMDELREKYNTEMLEMSKKVVEEPMPDPSTIYDFTYCGQKGRYW
jgi:2-oxoisovalerate dehydrogenase E1 component alpha subunit